MFEKERKREREKERKWKKEGKKEREKERKRDIERKKSFIKFVCAAKMGWFTLPLLIISGSEWVGTWCQDYETSLLLR